MEKDECEDSHPTIKLLMDVVYSTPLYPWGMLVYP